LSSILPSDVESLVSDVESGINVPETVRVSSVGSSLGLHSIWSSLSVGRNTSDLDIIVRSRVKSSKNEWGFGGRGSVDLDIDPDSSGMDSVGNVPSLV